MAATKITRIDDPARLHPRLREAWVGGLFKEMWQDRLPAQGRLGLRLFETHRPTEEQRRRYEMRDAKGRRVTTCDGIVRWSCHQDDPSTAMDFVVLLDGKMTWGEDLSEDDASLVMMGYYTIADVAEEFHLESGGRWRSQDWPHVQLTVEDRVEEVQRMLAVLGYDVGEVDGIHGPRTEAALRRFSREAGVGYAHVVGRIHPSEWTALWRLGGGQ